MSRQQHAPQPERERTTAQPSVHDDLERRKDDVVTAREEEQQQDAAIRAERDAIAMDEAELQQRIDQLLSSSPEEFVIRFLQTEGE